MPLPVENLTPNSTTEAVRTAISNSIAQCMREGGGDQAKCADIAYSIAGEKTGKELGREA